MPTRETLVVASSWPNSEALAVHVVLAHTHAASHPYTWGLRRGVALVATMLIDYDKVEIATRMTTRRRRS
jgi:hypothetical protein